MIRYCIVVRMSTNPHVTERNQAYTGAYHGADTNSEFVVPYDQVAFVERLPLALSYAASLDHGDHAILFYDSLVVATEYFCAYIDEGIKRHESTWFIGLPRVRYEKLFEQVGVKVAQLENCGYLSHFSIEDFYMEGQKPNKDKARRNIENLLHKNMESDCRGIRFIHVREPYMEHDDSFQDLIELERWLSTLSSYPMSTICAYDARMVLFDEAAPGLFTELLKAHGHCFFQGMAMPTSTLLETQIGPIYPKLRLQ